MFKQNICVCDLKNRFETLLMIIKMIRIIHLQRNWCVLEYLLLRRVDITKHNMFSHVRLLILPSTVRGQALRFFSDMANPKVFFDVSIGKKPAGRIVMEVILQLSWNVMPKVTDAGFYYTNYCPKYFHKKTCHLRIFLEKSLCFISLTASPLRQCAALDMTHR